MGWFSFLRIFGSCSVAFFDAAVLEFFCCRGFSAVLSVGRSEEHKWCLCSPEPNNVIGRSVWLPDAPATPVNKPQTVVQAGLLDPRTTRTGSLQYGLVSENCTGGANRTYSP